MKKSVIATTILCCCSLVACSGVDRDGTKDKIIKGLAGAGITEEQSACIADSIDEFSDDELKNLDSNDPDPELTSKLTDLMTTCIAGDLLSTDTTTG